MAVGGVVAVQVVVDGDERRDGVMGRLHKVGGLEHLLTFTAELVEEEFGILDTA